VHQNWTSMFQSCLVTDQHAPGSRFVRDPVRLELWIGLWRCVPFLFAVKY